MEYNDLQSFERLTGLAFFTPSGQSGAIPFDNIEMVKSDYGLKSIDSMASVRGRLQLRKRSYYQALPVFSIDGNQFATPLIPLLLLGTAQPDFAQSAASAQTFTFTAQSGLAFSIGAYNIQIETVKVGATTMVLGTDYFVDDPSIPQSLNSFNGTIILPVDQQGILDGDTVVVTFDQPALVMEQYQAFTNLDRVGALFLFAEDDAGPPAKEIWQMQVSLSCKKGADFDPTKFRKFTLEAALLGDPIVLKRGNVEMISLGVGGDTLSWT